MMSEPQQARVLLIIPHWPCQPWFLVLLGMLQDYPLSALTTTEPDIEPLKSGVHNATGD